MNQTVEVIQTGLTANYVGYWSVMQGIKEAAQNIVYGAIKSESRPEVTWYEGFGYLQDFYNGFEKRHLYLGESEQRHDEDGLGNFGEGWKLFLLIAARNGLQHRVNTVGFSFYGEMADTPHGVQALQIIVAPNERRLGTEVKIECSEEDFKQATSAFAYIEGVDNKFFKDNALIPGRFGELWVNGVLVENAESRNPLNLKYSYNLNDRKLVNRDRSQVNTEAVYGQTKRIWATIDNPDLIHEYLNAALAGELQEDIQRGPDGILMNHATSLIWKQVMAEKFETEPDKLVLSSRNTRLDKEAEYRGYKIVRLPDKWHHGLYWMGIKEVSTVIKLKAEYQEIENLSTQENRVLNKARRNVKKALGLESIEDLPPILVVESITDANNAYNGRGLWDREAKHILICRSELEYEKSATEVLLHEALHWKTGAGDGDAEFVDGFSKAILNLLGYK